MQAIEMEMAIVKGEIRVKLPEEINAEKARLIVLYESELPAKIDAQSDLLQLLDEITSHRHWPDKSKAEIDRAIDEERDS